MSAGVHDERLLDLACDALPPAEAREVEAHVAACPACAEALARMRATRRTMAALGPEPAPERGAAAMLAAAKAQAARNAARKRRRVAMWLAPTAAAAGLAVAISWQVMGGGPELPGRSDPEAIAMRSAPAPQAEAAPPPAAAPEPSAPPAAAPADDRMFATPPPEERAAAPTTASPARTTSRKAADAEPQPVPRHAEAMRGETDAGPAVAEVPPPRQQAAPATAPPAAPAPERDARAAAPERSATRAAEAEERAEAAAPGRAATGPAAPSAPTRVEPAPQADAGDEPAGAAGTARDRYGALRAAGQLRGELRTFPGCEVEAWRKVEVDGRGRVVSYVREGRVDGRRVRVEHLFDPSGALSSATAYDLDAGGPGRPAAALGLSVPARAEAAGLDAPPRCAR
jgi:hypothetical protein